MAPTKQTIKLLSLLKFHRTGFVTVVKCVFGSSCISNKMWFLVIVKWPFCNFLLHI